ALPLLSSQTAKVWKVGANLTRSVCCNRSVSSLRWDRSGYSRETVKTCVLQTVEPGFDGFCQTMAHRLVNSQALLAFLPRLIQISACAGNTSQSIQRGGSRFLVAFR